MHIFSIISDRRPGVSVWRSFRLGCPWIAGIFHIVIAQSTVLPRFDMGTYKRFQPTIAESDETQKTVEGLFFDAGVAYDWVADKSVMQQFQSKLAAQLAPLTCRIGKEWALGSRGLFHFAGGKIWQYSAVGSFDWCFLQFYGSYSIPMRPFWTPKPGTVTGAVGVSWVPVSSEWRAGLIHLQGSHVDARGSSLEWTVGVSCYRPSTSTQGLRFFPASYWAVTGKYKPTNHENIKIGGEIKQYCVRHFWGDATQTSGKYYLLEKGAPDPSTDPNGTVEQAGPSGFCTPQLTFVIDFRLTGPQWRHKILNVKVRLFKGVSSFSPALYVTLKHHKLNIPGPHTRGGTQAVTPEWWQSSRIKASPANIDFQNFRIIALQSSVS